MFSDCCFFLCNCRVCDLCMIPSRVSMVWLSNSGHWQILSSMVSVCTVLGTLLFLDSSPSPSLSSETTSWQSAFGRVTLSMHSNWGSCLRTIFQYQKRARQLAHFRQIERIRLQKDPDKALEQDVFFGRNIILVWENFPSIDPGWHVSLSRNKRISLSWILKRNNTVSKISDFIHDLRFAKHQAAVYQRKIHCVNKCFSWSIGQHLFVQSQQWKHWVFLIA